MRSHLVSAAWLLVLGIAGSVALSLLSGQEIKPSATPSTGAGAAPVVAPGPKPLAVTLPPRPAAASALRAVAPGKPGIERLAPLPRQMYLSAHHAANWLSE